MPTIGGVDTIVRDSNMISNSDSDIAEFYRNNHQQTAEIYHTTVAAAQECSDIDAVVAEFKGLFLRQSSVRRGLLRVYRSSGADPFFDDMID